LNRAANRPSIALRIPTRRRPTRAIGGQARAEERAAYAFLAPWLIGLVVFLIAPLAWSIYISLSDEQLLRPGQFIGLENYRQIFTDDPSFYQSLGVTLRWIVLTTPLFLTAGLGLALLLNQKLAGMRIFRTILYIPAVLSGVAITILWAVLLNGDVGAVNTVLRHLGWADPPQWFQEEAWALPAVALMGLWGVGGGAVIFLAGLQNIPPHLYEAAEIDGAGPIQRFRHITLPMLSATLFFLLITAITEALLIIGPLIVIAGRGGGGGPADSLLFYMLYLYRVGFVQGQLGYAAALAWILTVIGVMLVTLTFRFERRFVFYDTD
jgi:multiple sugar transport system permease protein